MKEKISFWDFISNHSINIPIIQRDYAQGRDEVSIIRRNFLKNVRLALTDDDCFKPMFMDFVYGEENSKSSCITPLDGQQRLTTLWLIHWYFAYKSKAIDINYLAENEITLEDINQPDFSFENVSDDIKEMIATIRVLKKFSYATREEAREFCDHLCELPFSENEICDEIKNQHWYFDAFNNDPTISSMLTMIQGSGDEDGLELVFPPETTDYEKVWKKLISENADDLISFKYFALSDYKLTDDLYIKMNARGKLLSDFENFKADLVNYVKENEQSALEEAGLDKEDAEKKALEKQRDFAGFLDNQWTDIFWDAKNPESDYIDDMYFSFINRFLLVEICANSKESNEKIEDRIKEDEKYLLKKINDNEFQYSGFEEYKKEFANTELLSSLRNLLDALSKNIQSLNDLQDICFPRWEDKYIKPEMNQNIHPKNLQLKNDSYIDFIPYPRKKDGTEDEYEISELTLREQVAFYSICLYFLSSDEYNHDSFKNWMHFSWNIIDSVHTHWSIALMVALCKYFKKIQNHSHSIMVDLLDSDNNKDLFSYSSVVEQVYEEVEKARQIKTDEKGVWKKKLEEAENFGFFHGSIRFLYLDGDGNVDWDNFDKRYSNAQGYFDSTGIKKSLNKYDILKKYISFFNDWEEHFWNDFIFDSEKTTWIENLLNPHRRYPTNCLLMGKNIITSSPFDEPYRKYIHEYLVSSDAVKSFDTGSYFHYRKDWCTATSSLYPGVFAIHPYNTKTSSKIYFMHYRNNLLTSIKGITLLDEENESRRANGVCRGKDVKFIYSDHYFRWGADNNVYLMKNEDEDYAKKVFFTGSAPWDVDGSIKFTRKLQDLINNH